MPGPAGGQQFAMSWTSESGEALSRCAVPDKTGLRLEVSLPRSAALAAPLKLSLRDAHGGGDRSVPLAFERCEGADEIYSASVSFASPTLYFCSLDGQNASLGECSGETAQLLVYDGEKKPSSRLVGGVMYQIFPDRFFRSPRFSPKPKKGTEINPDWDAGVPRYPDRPGGEVDCCDFFGGSLYGVTDKLDYLSSLGVTAIYLNPVFDAHTNHKYDTGDYETVDSMFGGEKALKELISEAGKRGISVILDGVFNHTGADSRYFNRYGSYRGAGAYGSRRSPYYKWYDFRNWPDDYECWWGVKLLPATREDSSFPEYIRKIVGDRTAGGIAGWRLDVADELSDRFIGSISAAAKEKDGGAVIIGEVWEDASNKVAYDVRKRYLQGGELDSVMNYPLRKAVVDYLRGGSAADFASAVSVIYDHYPRSVCDTLMNFLGTHDTMRIINTLSSAADKNEIPENEPLASLCLTAAERAEAKRKAALAWLICASMYGVPCVYYGDEIGMEGWRDPFCRLPMKWNDADAELTAVYRAVNSLRRSTDTAGSFADGEFGILYAEGSFVSFRRGEAVVCLNAGETPECAVFDRRMRMVYPEPKEGVKSYIAAPCSGAVFMPEE